MSKHFGRALLPDESEETRSALEWVEECDSRGFLAITYQFLQENPTEENESQNLRLAFEIHLDMIEGSALPAT